MRPTGAAPLVFAATTSAAVLAATPVTLWLVARNGQFEAEVVAYTLGFVALTLVGGLLVARRATNVLGWVVAAAGAMPAVSMLAYQYAIFGLLTAPGSLPGAVFAAWLANWTFFPALGVLIMLVPVLFPTGSPPSRRWRPLVWSGGALVVLNAVGEAFTPGRLGFIQEVAVTNPVGVAALGPLLDAVGGAVFGLYALLGVGSLVSLVVRFRRAGTVERQQIEWLLYAVGVGLGALLVSEFVVDATALDDTVAAEVLYLVGAGALWVGPPVAIWLAVTRRRLYEIDRLVNRTVVYALVTAVLAAGYAGLVVVLQPALTPVTAGSDLAVAGSTLAVAAAFGPVRRRVQAAVDRRFNRARYDAARTAEAFGHRLRDEVDLETLTADVERVVGATLQPATARLWLRAAREVRG